MTEFYKSRSVTERVYMDLLAIISSKKRPGDVKLNYEEGSSKQRGLLLIQPAV